MIFNSMDQLTEFIRKHVKYGDLYFESLVIKQFFFIIQKNTMKKL